MSFKDYVIAVLSITVIVMILFVIPAWLEAGLI